MPSRLSVEMLVPVCGKMCLYEDVVLLVLSAKSTFCLVDGLLRIGFDSISSTKPTKAYISAFLQ